MRKICLKMETRLAIWIKNLSAEQRGITETWRLFSWWKEDTVKKKMLLPMLLMLLSLAFTVPVYAVGDGNIDNGAASVSA